MYFLLSVSSCAAVTAHTFWLHWELYTADTWKYSLKTWATLRLYQIRPNKLARCLIFFYSRDTELQFVHLATQYEKQECL